MQKTQVAASLLATAAVFAAAPAVAQIAVSANDGKVKMENGVVKTVPDNPDTVAIIDLRTMAVTGEIKTGRGPDGLAWATRK